MILGSLNKNNLSSQKYVHFAFWNILTKLFPETLYQFPFPLAVFESLLSPYFYLFSTPFLIIFILFLLQANLLSRWDKDLELHYIPTYNLSKI